MLTKWLVVFIFYKNINNFSSHAESWDGIAPKPITENTKIIRQKPSRSYMASPLLPSIDVAESIFPDVIYPTSILDVREPSYFVTSGSDDLLRPFSDDVKNSYKALKSENDKKNNFATHKTQSIQNMKNSNKNVKASIFQENYINNSKVFNCDDEAIEPNNKTKFDIITLTYDLLNVKDDIEFRNITHNLDNVINNTSLQEIKLPLETSASVIEYTQNNITNEEYLNTRIILNNVEECVIVKELNKTEEKSDVNITAICGDYDTKVVSKHVEECVVVKVSNKTEIENDVNATFISGNCNIISNDTNCFEWAQYENEKLSDEFNHLINHDFNNISKSDFLKKLFNTKKIYDSILHILQNVNDADHLFLNSSLITMDTITEDGHSNKYYDNVVDNTSLHELSIETETEAVSNNNRYNFFEIRDSYADYIGEETRATNNISMEIAPRTPYNVINSSESSCILPCDKRNEINEIRSIDDVAFDIIEIFCDYPEEINVKSSANSIKSTFDGFKSNKNPFLVLFHHFPSPTISDP